jgi:hypothetical protein
VKAKTYIDGVLIEWGEQFFDPRNFLNHRARSNSGGGGRPRRQPQAGGGSITSRGGRLEAMAVRAKLAALVAKSPQVMVKVYGGGRGMKEIRAHMRYIARVGREGEVPMEDNDGFRVKGAEAVRELAEGWKFGEVTIPEESQRREALNIVLSMPEGTDPIAVQKAARDFAAREFTNHRYAMALHTEDTPHYASDKNDPPTKHPHVHLIVQMGDQEGHRLNPRKADLHRWRENFAAALREHGVDAVATSRAHRLERRRGDNQAIRRMKDANRAFTKARGSKKTGARAQRSAMLWDVRVARARQTEEEIRRRYSEVGQILNESEDPADRVLARELVARFQIELPPPPEKGRAMEDKNRRNDPTDRATQPKRTGTDDRGY